MTHEEHLRLAKEASVHKLKAMKHEIFDEEDTAKEHWRQAAALELQILQEIPKEYRRYLEVVGCYYKAGLVAEAQALEIYLTPEERETLHDS